MPALIQASDILFLAETYNTTTESQAPGELEPESGVSWTEIIKIFLIGLKCVYFAVFLIFSIMIYKRQHQTHFTKEIMLFYFFLVEMGMIIVFDLFAKYIMILYFMLVASNYAVFLIFTFLVKNPRLGHGQHKQKLFSIVFYVIHALYASVFFMAFIPGLGASCTQTVVYPFAFYYMYGVDMLVTIVGLVFYFNGWFMRSDYQPLDENQDIQDRKILSFKKQIKIFTIVHTVVSCIQVFFFCLMGYFKVQQSGALACIDDGNKWAIKSQFGNSFVTLQVILVMLHCAICVNVYYRIPKSFNLLEEEPIDKSSTQTEGKQTYGGVEMKDNQNQIQ
eukprot:403373806